MNFTAVDIAIFVVFYAIVLSFSFFKSRGEKNTADYFLGGRALPWWLIGVSVVAANLSTEQFVGMAGQAAGDAGSQGRSLASVQREGEGPQAVRDARVEALAPGQL